MNLILTSEHKYFFDTYAIIELIKKNKNYERFKNVDIVSGILNYGELFLWTLRENLKLKKYLEKLKRYTLQIEITDVIEAMMLKFKYKGRRMSVVDCIGYVMALRRGLAFITGGKAFEDLQNVEFVK